MKAERTDDEIRVLWLPRYEYSNGYVSTINANGEVESRVLASRVRYEKGYRDAGSIPIDDALVEFCGVAFFDRFIYAVMVHATRLVAGGWGETPSEVVGWFKDFEQKNYINGEYKFISPGTDPFVGLEGCAFKIDHTDEDVMVVRIAVREAEFSVELADSKTVTAFLLSTIPII